MGSHSTSDDQSLYQDMEQVEYWSRHLYPVTRLKLYMIEKGIWNEEKEETIAKDIDKQIKVAACPPPPICYCCLHVVAIVIVYRAVFRVLGM